MNIQKKLLWRHYSSRGGWTPLIVVVHIADGSYEQTLSEFQNEEKSSHYFVKYNGDIVQFVEEKNAAWTNGIVIRPTSELIKQISINQITNVNPNWVSVTIETEGFGNMPITEAQYDSLRWLTNDICERHGISKTRKYILRHNEIRADKTCPGKIDLDRIVREIQPTLPNPLPVNKMTPEQKQSIWNLIVAFVSDLAILERLKDILGTRTFGAARAGDWYSWRKQHIKTACEYCGRKGTIFKPLQLHHVEVFHKNPAREKDPDNVCTLCSECHLRQGHLMSYQSWNETIKEDCKVWIAKIENRP